jgi:hypothetical protein
MSPADAGQASLGPPWRRFTNHISGRLGVRPPREEWSGQAEWMRFAPLMNRPGRVRCLRIRTAVPLAASTWQLDQRRRTIRLPGPGVAPQRRLRSAAVLPSRPPRPLSGWLPNRTPRTPWLSAAAPGTAVGIHKVGVHKVGVHKVGVCRRHRRSRWVATATGSGRRPGGRWRRAATAGRHGRADGRAGRQAGRGPGSWPVAPAPGRPRWSARPTAGPAGRRAASRRPPPRRPPGGRSRPLAQVSVGQARNSTVRSAANTSSCGCRSGWPVTSSYTRVPSGWGTAGCRSAAGATTSTLPGCW